MQSNPGQILFGRGPEVERPTAPYRREAVYHGGRAGMPASGPLPWKCDASRGAGPAARAGRVRGRPDEHHRIRPAPRCPPRPGHDKVGHRAAGAALPDLLCGDGAPGPVRGEVQAIALLRSGRGDHLPGEGDPVLGTQLDQVHGFHRSGVEGKLENPASYHPIVNRPAGSRPVRRVRP